ncbi:DUF1905 domain-containing protein [Nocardioides limicola]|uniref:DUF1905 domain-containing protein n=1 Tax=Nocardioides limicola TaxID=2803368 RepID=UPI00193B9ABC|nr:DUF1905 domain-containing protein [Nocardioides sp. DJM-14]
MDFEFVGELVEWRGPAPFHFVRVPVADSEDMKDAGRDLLYWGQLPVTVLIGETEFGTAMWEREGAYLLPVKADVRRAEGLTLGDLVPVALRLGKDEAGAPPA